MYAGYIQILCHFAWRTRASKDLGLRGPPRTNLTHILRSTAHRRVSFCMPDPFPSLHPALYPGDQGLWTHLRTSTPASCLLVQTHGKGYQRLPLARSTERWSICSHVTHLLGHSLGGCSSHNQKSCHMAWTVLHACGVAVVPLPPFGSSLSAHYPLIFSLILPTSL